MKFSKQDLDKVNSEVEYLRQRFNDLDVQFNKVGFKLVGEECMG